MKPRYLLLLVTFSIIHLGVSAQIVITFENAPASPQCDEVWTEEGLEINFTSTTSSDCNAGSCFFETTDTFVWLYPSRMSINLSSLENISKIEIDVIDYCGADCTKSFLIDANGNEIVSAGNTMNSTGETITLLNPTEEQLSQLAISSCEGQVQDVRIFQNPINKVNNLIDNHFEIYPNPIGESEDLNITFSNNSLLTSLEQIDIFNLQGQMIYRKEYKDIESLNHIKIPGSELPKGICIVRFKLGDLILRKRIVRQ